jgi:trehalose-6-phosphatase
VKLERENLVKTIWFLDFDGCMCPHQEVWEERCYDAASILSLVKDLSNQAAGVYWNTGRRVESLGSVCPEFLDCSGYFVQGSLYWNAQTRETKVLGLALPDDFRAYMEDLVTRHPELRLEIKPTSLRLAPLNLHSLDALKSLLASESKAPPKGWRWSIGHRGAELLAEGIDKGTAISREMSGRLARDIKPVAVGDDILDRRAVEEALARGGYAVLVGESCGWVAEIPHQPWQLNFFQSPDHLHEWIRSLVSLRRNHR